MQTFLPFASFIHSVERLDAYPTGYYWPVEPIGKKAKADSAAWLEWGKKNGIDG